MRICMILTYIADFSALPEPPCKEIIDDIEDLISAQDFTPKERYSSRKHVKISAKRRTV